MCRLPNGRLHRYQDRRRIRCWIRCWKLWTTSVATRNMFAICYRVSTTTPSMSSSSPGKLGYVQWLTVANRILRRYVSVSHTIANLILTVNFVINVYAKAWFYIKTKSLFTDSPAHLFNMIQNAVQLDDSRELKKS